MENHSSRPSMGDLLIVSHPGHELLMYGWMKVARPTVHALTDGSGGRGRPRIGRSRQVIEGAKARCGSVFGKHSDATWYDAILRQDAAPFLDAADTIVAEVDRGIDIVATDAVEHFNPMHDMAAVVAAIVARRTNAKHLLCHAIEYKAFPGQPKYVLELDETLQAEKRNMASGYLELAREVDVFLTSPLARREVLFVWDPAFAFPPTLAQPPFYEEFGRRRVKEGRFTRLITYEQHVRPLALQLLSSAHDAKGPFLKGQ
jgi:hypothetical protein